MIQDSRVFSGFKIKGLRLKNHKNLQEVAKALDITTSYLSSIENGKKEPSSKVISKAAVYFDIPEASFHEPSEYLNDIKEIVKQYLSGFILDSGESCHQHENGHICSHKE